MAEGGFLTKRILLVKEDTTGAIPSNPICVEFLAESFDYKETQASEDINLLGSGGDASASAFGVSSYGGSIGLVATVDNMPIMLTHTLGAAKTSANATADDWTATTAYTVGDIVNTVADTTHTLVCVTAGTTGADEASFTPALETNPNDDRNAKIVDGTVTWIAMPKLITDTYELTQQIPSFSVEYEMEDAAGNLFIKRFSNVYSNSLPIGMSGGTISLKMSGDFVGATATDSTEAGFVALADTAGAKIVPNFKQYYAYEDCSVELDSVALCKTESINLDTARNIDVSSALNGCNIVDIGTASVKGNMNKVFTIADYEAYKAHENFKVEFIFTKSNGCGMTMTYTYVTPSKADGMMKVDGQAMISPEISASGTATVKSVLASITYPALFDSTGAITNTTGAY